MHRWHPDLKEFRAPSQKFTIIFFNILLLFLYIMIGVEVH